MILFYVSGHGFGHATRTNSIIEAVLDRRPRMRIAVRTLAPAWLFDQRVLVERVAVDPPVHEDANALQVDAAASARAVREFAEGLPELVRNEADWVCSEGVRLIFADAPFLAGFVGKAAGVPVITGSNFLWDWILEGQPGVEIISEGYSLSNLALRYPLSHDTGWDVFPRSEQVPLVTPRSQRDRAEIRNELGLTGETRPVVLIGGRAVLDEAGQARLGEFVSYFRFLTSSALPNYHDLVRASDAVVSKAGYSIVAECIAERRPLLYPPRTGFREEQMLVDAARPLMRVEPIDPELWKSGEWGAGLQRLLQQPEPRNLIDTHGAQTVAEILVKTAA